ncbi:MULTISPECIES: phage minor tail protein L [Pantoea]|jgi:lambda family phage minor tail protein L|uniref:phage minor tail protein L n=1 Tax=Pantoea TaxID=53335 RepID=UPI000EA2BBC8|nr:MULTISPECIES: phage minor tail protein L [Pantoea]MBZ6387396.1 phage minor tail protein L [Pantoea piersonii]MBZ6400707.1 phage minor tail protein L [Pantoea piersonii]MBZ6408681.1 phage minor tail protein L [Pantoea piersonii]NYB00593.1 phage minor tail protein L [Pantoea piersonii]NYB08140.1 phage minor tail protein L [Pantoea piersonii]
MNTIPSQMLSELTRTESSARIELWEADLTTTGGKRYFFCNEQNELGKAVVWQKRRYRPYPVRVEECGMSGRGPSARPSIVVSNLYGIVTGLAEAHQSLVGAAVIRRTVCARFLDAENFRCGNPDADPQQEVVSRYVIEQLAELTSLTARFILAVPTETEGLLYPGRIMLADLCPWEYRSADCGYKGPVIADSNGRPVTDAAQDHCGNCAAGCRLRQNIGRFGGFLSLNAYSEG